MNVQIELIPAANEILDNIGSGAISRVVGQRKRVRTGITV